MEYHLNMDKWGSVFAVPSIVADNYLKLASGSALKVLLYLLRNNNKNYSETELASILGISEENVEEAICFWEHLGVLIKANVLTNNTINSNSEQSLTNMQPPIVQNTEKLAYSQRTSSGFNLTPSQISEKINNSNEIRVLFNMAESSLGNVLTYTEQRSLLWMYEYLGLKPDVILMLLEYCVSIDKKNMRYVETIAVSWQENDINTLDVAQKEIKRLQELHTFTSKVMHSFEMHRKPTKKQREFLETWKNQGYSLDLIEYAYEKTIDAIGKPSFPYINTILQTWYKNGLITVNKVNEWYKANPNTKYMKTREEQSYTLEELDSLALNFRKGE